MRFDIFAQVTLLLINAIGILLAWWMYRSDSEKKLKTSYLLMTVFMLLWADFSYLGSRSQSLIQANIFYRLNWASVCLFFPSFYNFFIIHFLRKDKNAKVLGIIIFIFSLLLLSATIFSSLIIETVVERSWGMEVVFGPYYLVFNLFSALVAAIVVFYSLHGYRSMTRIMRRKINFFLGGIFIFILMNLVFNVFSQILFQSVEYQILGDFSSIFLLGFTAYASIQYRLFDIKVITTESLTALLLVILFAKIFTSPDSTSLVINIITFSLALIFGFLLVRSVIREVSQKEKLQELTKKLRELDAQKDEFLNVAAHELRAPMTAIKGYLSMISDGDGGKVSKKLAEFVGEAELENDRLIRLVNNLLNISRIEEGRMVFELGKVDLSKVVETNFKNFEGQAKEKNLKYSLEIEKGVRDKVEVDVDRIHEVVANLLSNAIKYTDTGFVKASLKNRENHVRFEVEDSGAGLSEQEQQKLFQKFYRAESSINKQIGTGLGLYISKLLVEHFNGQIGMSSEIGKGSTFWFELPHKK